MRSATPAALDALDLQTRHFLGLVVAEPAAAVVAPLVGCPLESFPTQAGTWFLCPTHGWYSLVVRSAQVGTPAVVQPVCPLDGR